uniref:Uncharacterized protein n=1 Tax=Stomoxys calcitrans TaxID=35570 RepID=A0A1I8NPB7_STOCA
MRILGNAQNQEWYLSDLKVVELMMDKPLDDECLIELITYEAKTEIHNSDNDDNLNHFLKNYSNMKRALKFERDINNCIAGYKELYKELKKPKVQLSIKEFLIKKSMAQEISKSSLTAQNFITGRKSPLDNLMDISSDDKDFSPIRRKEFR